MGKNNKKKKGHGAEKTAAKTERKAARKAKKEARTAGEDDVDAVVAQLEAEESAKCRPLVELPEDGYRPTPRSSFSWTANPRGQEIYLFGGEQRLPGGRLRVLNEHLVYRPADNRWTRLGSGTLPTPRCAHQAALGKPTGQGVQLFVFGGEYATPTESQFHHYGDLWSWTVKTRQWRKVLTTASAAAPCPRSGHRMVALRRPRLRLLVFGGFQDNGRAFRYLSDLWSYDCDAGDWTEIRAAGPPSPRSACLLFPLPDDAGLCVIGGYSKRTEKRSEKGVVHTDCYTLSLTAAKPSAEPSPQSPQQTAQPQPPAAAAWQPMKFSGQRPTPRCGVSGAVNTGTGRAYAFGGVFDIEQADDGMTGVMFNELYQIDLTKQRWRLVDIGATACSDGNDSGAAAAAVAAAPCERINAGLAVMDDMLYLYGGIFEGEDDDEGGGAGEGERSRTLDDLHCLNLKRLDADWTTLLAATDLGGDGDDSSSASASSDEGEETEEAETVDDAAGDPDAVAVAAGPPAVVAGESADVYATRTCGYWSRAVGDSLKRCWQPDDVTEALVAKYARRAARDFYWQTAADT